jgi:hypothetical protein
MVFGKPQQRMSRVAGDDFGNDAEAIDVGSEAGTHHSGLLAPVQGCDAGDEPTGEQMSGRAHE